jgi:hypothetical protein
MSEIPQPTETETQKSYQCRHILTAGRRCRSNSLRNENFCYYHHTTRRPAPYHRGNHPVHAEFELPSLEDRASIQHSLSQVLNRITTNQLDEKRARLLLYGLQIAAYLLPREPRAQQSRRDNRNVYFNHQEAPEAQIEDLTHDPDLGPLAPIAEVTPPQERKGFAQRLLEELRSRQTEEQAEEEKQEEAEPELPAETIPTIQAVAETATTSGAPSSARLFAPKVGIARRATAPSTPPTAHLTQIIPRLYAKTGRGVERPHEINPHAHRTGPTEAGSPPQPSPAQSIPGPPSTAGTSCPAPRTH